MSKKTKKDKLPNRNPFVLPAKTRKAGPMKPKGKKRTKKILQDEE